MKRRSAVATLALLAVLATLVPAPAAWPAQPEPKTTLSDLEDEVMCPTCGTALSLSESPLADRQRAFIQRLVDEGRSKDEIKARLVDEFGPEVLAAPPRQGFALTAYLVPLAGFVLVVGSLGLVLLRRRGTPAVAAAAPAGDRFEDLVDADLAGADDLGGHQPRPPLW